MKYHSKSIHKLHIISYDLDDDILPLIRKHSNFNLRYGHGTDVTYDFAPIQLFIIENYIRGKPLLQRENMISQFTYVGEMKRHGIFKALKAKIPQIELSEEIQQTINHELNNEQKELYQKNDYLKSLEICINFLLQTGGQPQQSLRDYALTLGIAKEDKINKGEIAVSTQLQHVYSLWVLLDKAVDEKSTEKLDEKYKKKLSEADKKLLLQYSSKLKPEQLKILVMSWKDYILMLSDDSTLDEKKIHY